MQNFGTLVENCKLLVKIGTTRMRSIIIVGSSSAIVMHLATCNKQIEKHWRQQLIMKHKFGYLKCVDLRQYFPWRGT